MKIKLSIITMLALGHCSYIIAADSHSSAHPATILHIMNAPEGWQAKQDGEITYFPAEAPFLALGQHDGSAMYSMASVDVDGHDTFLFHTRGTNKTQLTAVHKTLHDLFKVKHITFLKSGTPYEQCRILHALDLINETLNQSADDKADEEKVDYLLLLQSLAPKNEDETQWVTFASKAHFSVPSPTNIKETTISTAHNPDFITLLLSSDSLRVLKMENELKQLKLSECAQEIFKQAEQDTAMVLFDPAIATYHMIERIKAMNEYKEVEKNLLIKLEDFIRKNESNPCVIS